MSAFTLALRIPNLLSLEILFDSWGMLAALISCAEGPWQLLFRSAKAVLKIHYTCQMLQGWMWQHLMVLPPC